MVGSVGTLAGPGWRWWRKRVGHGGARDEEPLEVGGGRGKQEWEDPTERLDGQIEVGWKWILSEGEIMKNRVVNNENR